jgi:hypothetical protein
VNDVYLSCTDSAFLHDNVPMCTSMYDGYARLVSGTEILHSILCGHLVLTICIWERFFFPFLG